MLERPPLSPGRRQVLAATAALPFLSIGRPDIALAAAPVPRPPGAEGFDFLAGDWTVRHRKLARRLAGSSEWREFAGTMSSRPLLGGAGNVDDYVLDDPTGAYRAVALRLFDTPSRNWAIWWADPRYSMLALDPPMQGRFEHGEGRFLGESLLEGRSVKVRFHWSEIAADSAHWEQAFSPDGGESWETNWTMQFERRRS